MEELNIAVKCVTGTTQTQHVQRGLEGGDGGKI